MNITKATTFAFLVALALGAFVTPAAAIDTDGDGVDDVEEVKDFVDDPVDHLADTDGDGTDDIEEVKNSEDEIEEFLVKDATTPPAGPGSSAVTAQEVFGEEDPFAPENADDYPQCGEDVICR